MTDREKLIGLLDNFGIDDDWYTNTEIADYLLANGVTFASAVPGPSDADPNIMELCFHNGERHMKEKILKLLVGYSRASGNTFGPVYEHIISEVEKL